jgi:tetratricopeptide (TPR) repeat protein
VLHRDIKPSNVLVTSDGMPMLLDFNLAREPVVEDETSAGSATLGGTIDYMAPEHLKALGQSSAEPVDGRADIYGLGVVLYEAVTGQRPFTSPRRSSSVVEALLRAIDDRRRPLPPLRDRHPEIPPPLEAVIRQCLEPDPVDRYQTASELAVDLQAVADDLPLRHAREPWPSRAAGWLRRRRRRLAMAVVILLAATAVTGAVLSFVNQRAKDYRLVKQEYKKGLDAFEIGDFPSAKTHFQTAADLAERCSQNAWGYLTKLKNVRELANLLTDKLEELELPKDVEEIKAHALEKSQLADRIDRTRSAADALFDAADGLRFRLLLGEGNELVTAFQDLQKAIEPFYVLKSDDWTKLDHTLNLLDRVRRQRLLIEVNELLFLWMAAIDELLESSPDAREIQGAPPDREPVASARAICDRALVWAEPKGPWRAMAARLKALESRRRDRLASPAGPAAQRPDPAPSKAVLEPSPLACFQWGLLALRDRRLARAMEWVRRAAQLESRNHWYRYFLANLEDRAGYLDEALNDYSVALALEGESPWIRFSRARLYRSKGRWDVALDDMQKALVELSGKPEAGKVHLELGYLYHELGDFGRARGEYDRVIALGPTGPYGPAARLNRANLDAESGAVDRARREYDALLSEDFRDTSARMSRALLELRRGQAERAYFDCSALLEIRGKNTNNDEVLAARAMALLLLGRPDEAIADATLAERTRPSPAHERLRQRTLLAARRLDTLQLDQPDELALLPLGGRRLSADLRAAEDGLQRLAGSRPDETFRASLNLAVILAARGQNDAAVAAATRALQVSPYSPRAYLIRARVHTCAGDHQRARDDIQRGLSIQLNEPGLLELKGVLRAAAGDHTGALEDFDVAIVSGAVDRVHLHKASALVALGRVEAAVQEWSLALRRDPELPEAYLGRARAHLSLRQWDMALADLEQAASWAHSDPRIELGIVSAYFQCLSHRPDRLPRWLALAFRAVRDVWGVLIVGPSRRGRPS